MNVLSSISGGDQEEGCCKGYSVGNILMYS